MNRWNHKRPSSFKEKPFSLICSYSYYALKKYKHRIGTAGQASHQEIFCKNLKDNEETLKSLLHTIKFAKHQY